MHLPIHLIHTIIERKLLSQGKNPAEEFLLIQVKVCEVCEKDKVLRDIKKSQLSDPERELNGCLLSFFLLLVHNLAKVFLKSYLNCHKEFILSHQLIQKKNPVVFVCYVFEFAKLASLRKGKHLKFSPFI